MINELENFGKLFLEQTENKGIQIISHFDTDGITSAAILGRLLQKIDRKFGFTIVKSLEKEFFESLPKNKVLVFLSLGSSNLSEFEKLENDVFIIDHHEISTYQQLPANIQMINPRREGNTEGVSTSCLTYLFAKELAKKDSKSANLAIVGLVGEVSDKQMGPIAQSIISDADLTLKRGILLYPSTRPLNRTLEYSSNPYIPGVTGNYAGVVGLLKEAKIPVSETGYKALADLTEEEMQKLITATSSRLPDPDKMQEFIGNLYLIKNFGTVEDAREVSALINACSRMGDSNVALLLCMGNNSMKKQAEQIYIKYKQNLIEALNQANTNPKIQGSSYVIMNAKDKIQDTIIGTVASILSMSALYKEGTVIITMAYNEDKIKVSSRISGRDKIEGSLNLRDLMNQVTESIGGEPGGHRFEAGCIINKDKEEAFIELVKKKLEFETIKI